MSDKPGRTNVATLRSMLHYRRQRGWALGATGALGVMLLLIPGAVGASPNVISVSHLTLTNGSTVTTPGTGHFCLSGHTGNTGYICDWGQVVGTSGYVRIFQQFQADGNSSSLSGDHSFYGRGQFALGTGFAHLHLNCTAGASGYARVFIFWHVWVYDRTLGGYVTQSNSGYIWDSGYHYCASGGGTATARSPALIGAFNSSAYTASATGPVDYNFTSGHKYVFTLYVGCTAEVDVSGPSTASAWAGCNFPAHSSSNTVRLASVVLV